MQKIQKKPTLYKTPFSKAYWRDAALEMKDTRMLVFAALMIALRVAMKGLYIPLGPTLKINSAFFVNALGAMVFGPVVAALAAIVSDVLGYILWPQVGPYFLPYVLIEIAGSMIFALFLYRAKVTPTRVILSRFCIDFFVNIVLNAPITYLFYKMVMGKSYVMFQIPHILKNLAMFPVESVLLTLFLSAMIPITNRMRMTYPCGSGPDAGKLRFNKKQIALLAVLFVIGVGCVFGYLNYYYATTSLSANYSAEERYQVNTSMIDVVQDQSDEFDQDTLVTTVESAYKKFLGKTTTYHVAVYVVQDSALTGYDKDLETIRGLSKSKAKAVAEDGIMTRSADAVIVLDNASGSVVSFEME